MCLRSPRPEGRLQGNSSTAMEAMLSSYAGYTAAQLFGQGTTYTYDDVIFLPGHINFGAHEASTVILQSFVA